GLNLSRRLNPRDLLGGFRRLVRLLKKEAPDILHTHLSHDHWLGAIAARQLKGGPRTLRTFHSPRAIRWDPAHRFLFNSLTHASVAVSGFIGKLLVHRGGVRPECVYTIPGAVDTERFSPEVGLSTRERYRELLGIEEGAPAAGIVARVRKERGHAELLMAFRRVSEELPQARLVIVGKGEGLPGIKALARDLGLEAKVIFTGYRETDLREILGALDVFVLLRPGSEGSGRAALEAMAMGLPCVVADGGGLGELVAQGETGLIVPRGDEGALSGALLKLLREPELARAMGRRGRERALTDFSQGLRAERTEALYFKFLEGEGEKESFPFPEVKGFVRRGSS
ncbi:MAG: glycosyltransferase, partial [Nitrospinota bacterium]